MKTCTNCGRTFSDNQTMCPACRCTLESPHASSIAIEVDMPAEETYYVPRETAVPEYDMPPRPTPCREDRQEYRQPEPFVSEYTKPTDDICSPEPADPAQVQLMYRTDRSLTALQQLLIAAAGLCTAVNAHFNTLRVNGFLLLNGDYCIGISIGIALAAVGLFCFLKTHRQGNVLSGNTLENACISPEAFANLFGRLTRPVIKGSYWLALLACFLLFIAAIGLWEECSMLFFPLISPKYPGYYLTEHLAGTADSLVLCALLVVQLLKSYYAIFSRKVYLQLIQLRKEG